MISHRKEKENILFVKNLAFPTQVKKLIGVKYINKLKNKKLNLKGIRDPFAVFMYEKPGI